MRKYVAMRAPTPPFLFWIMIVTCRGSGMWGKNVEIFENLSFYKRNKMGRRVPSLRNGGVSSFLDRSINWWCWGPRNLGATSTLSWTLFWVGSNGVSRVLLTPAWAYLYLERTKEATLKQLCWNYVSAVRISPIFISIKRAETALSITSCLTALSLQAFDKYPLKFPDPYSAGLS